MPGCCAVTWSNRVLFLLLISSLPGVSSAADDGTATQAPQEPINYLEIYEVNSARCQSLRRGKMRMLRNVHPTQKIRYHMTRSLAGKRQAGLIRDTIYPADEKAEEAEALGCELLDGMQQEWTVTRAEFVP